MWFLCINFYFGMEVAMKNYLHFLIKIMCILGVKPIMDYVHLFIYLMKPLRMPMLLA